MNSLIDEIRNCKVEWRKLGDVSEIGTGNFNRQDENQNGKYPFFVRSKNILKSNKFQFDEEAIILPGEGGIGDIFHYVNGKYALHQRAYRIHIKNHLNTKFIYYYMYAYFKRYIMTKSVGATSISIRKPMLENFPIPIPPLDIQEKIVKILDTFTELTTELTARRKQYSYYLNKLLTFKDDEVEWRKLGEVGELIRGNGMQKNDFTTSGFPAIHYGQIYTQFDLFANKTFTFISNDLAKKLKIAHKNDLLIATTSENDDDLLKAIAWFGSDVAISGDMMLLRHNQNVKYLAYYFQTDYFQKQKIKYITGAKVRRISKDNLAKIKIPIPPLEKQKEIVAILDKFYTLTNSISEGLPKEIDLRKKQYEYYRNLLLDFK